MQYSLLLLLRSALLCPQLLFLLPPPLLLATPIHISFTAVTAATGTSIAIAVSIVANTAATDTSTAAAALLNLPLHLENDSCNQTSGSNQLNQRRALIPNSL